MYVCYTTTHDMQCTALMWLLRPWYDLPFLNVVIYNHTGLVQERCKHLMCTYYVQTRGGAETCIGMLQFFSEGYTYIFLGNPVINIYLHKIKRNTIK